MKGCFYKSRVSWSVTEKIALVLSRTLFSISMFLFRVAVLPAQCVYTGGLLAYSGVWLTHTHKKHTHTEGGSDLVFLNGTNCWGLLEMDRITCCHPIKDLAFLEALKEWINIILVIQSYARQMLVCRTFKPLSAHRGSLAASPQFKNRGERKSVILPWGLTNRTESGFSSQAFHSLKVFVSNHRTGKVRFSTAFCVCASSAVCCLSGLDLPWWGGFSWESHMEIWKEKKKTEP